MVPLHLYLLVCESAVRESRAGGGGVGHDREVKGEKGG